MAEITVKVSARWWVRPLGHVLAFVSKLTTWRPTDAQADKLCTFIARHGFRYTV